MFLAMLLAVSTSTAMDLTDCSAETECHTFYTDGVHYFTAGDQALVEGRLPHAKDHGALAEKHLAQAAKLAPANAQVNAALGHAQFLKGDLRQAILTLTKSLELNADSAVVYRDLAIAQVELTGSKTAQTSLARSVKLDPSEENSQMIGRMLYVRHLLLVETANKSKDPIIQRTSLERAKFAGELAQDFAPLPAWKPILADLDKRLATLPEIPPAQRAAASAGHGSSPHGTTGPHGATTPKHGTPKAQTGQ